MRTQQEAVLSEQDIQFPSWCIYYEDPETFEEEWIVLFGALTSDAQNLVRVMGKGRVQHTQSGMRSLVIYPG